MRQLSFLSLLFFLIQYEQIAKDKKYILRNILFSNLTINLLINFVSFFIKSISSVFKNLCLCYVCKKQINTITKKMQKCNNNNNNNLITYIAQVFIKMIKCALQTTNLFTISKTIKNIHFPHKNLKYRYVTIKIHSTMSKLKKIRLNIALKSMQVWNITKLTPKSIP